MPNKKMSPKYILLYEIIGKNLRERRNQLKLTQTELAVKTGLSRGSIANIEVGRQAVTLHTLQLILEALESNNFGDAIPSNAEFEKALKQKESWMERQFIEDMKKGAVMGSFIIVAIGAALIVLPFCLGIGELLMAFLRGFK